MEHEHRDGIWIMNMKMEHGNGTQIWEWNTKHEYEMIKVLQNPLSSILIWLFTILN